MACEWFLKPQIWITLPKKKIKSEAIYYKPSLIILNRILKEKSLDIAIKKKADFLKDQ